MFGTIRRHQNWLWIIIITITILSFVIFFSPNVNLSGGGGRAAKVDLGSIDGKPITTEEFFEGYREARLNQFFQSGGQWPGKDEAAEERLRNAAVSRIFLMKKVQEYDIKVSDDAVVRLTRDRLGRELADNIDRFAAE